MMSNEFKIRINTIENAKDFSKICERFLPDVDVYYGRYIVDRISIGYKFTRALPENARFYYIELKDGILEVTTKNA